MSSLRMTTSMHNALLKHLFPGDGLEAAALLVCGVAGRNADHLVVRNYLLVPYAKCTVRTPTSLTWPSEYIEPALDLADAINGSVVLIHSHPGGMFDFSKVDNLSDHHIIPSLQHGGNTPDTPHGSAIMVPDGRIKARLYDRQMNAREILKISAISHDIRDLTSRAADRPLAFSAAMTEDLAQKVAVVVGVSGTGSIVAEQLGRLGVGKIILVDFDKVEEKNLNRILNATRKDIGRYKTHVVRDAIAAHHSETVVDTFETPIDDPCTLTAASEADIIFSCVDSVEGRYHCDLMVSAFVSPMVDVGVVIPTRCRNGVFDIADVCGRVDYVRPGGASLWDRGEITGEALASEYLRETDPDAHQRQVAEGYLKGFPEEAPSVISLNMRAASAAVHEWLARLYKIRHESNEKFASTYFSLAAGEEEYSAEPSCPGTPKSQIFGQGLKRPLLGLLRSETRKKDAA